MHNEREHAEQLRLRLCEKHGLEVNPRIVEDREGRSTYTLDSGGEGRPVLFVHGGGADAGEWIQLAASLQDAGHRVVLADRPGHGLSYPIEYGDVDYEKAAADWCEDVAEAISDEAIDIIANSMGGFFSLCYALRSTERINKLVLVGAPAGLDKWIPHPLRLMGFKPLNRLLFAQSRDWGVDDFRKLFGDILVKHPERVHEDELELAVAMSKIPTYEVAWRTLLEECVSLTGFNHMIRDRVAHLDLPTHFIWGDADVFAPPQSGIDLAKRMPNATIDVVADAGHLPWIDQPDEVTSLIIASLSDETEKKRTAA